MGLSSARRHLKQIDKKQATYDDKQIGVKVSNFIYDSDLNSNHFFDPARTTGALQSNEIKPIQDRLDEFRVPATSV